MVMDTCVMDTCVMDTGVMVMDTCVMDTCVVDTCIVDTCIVHTWIMDTCIMDTCIMDTCIIDTCIMETCSMDTSAWVTRPERLKGRKHIRFAWKMSNLYEFWLFIPFLSRRTLCWYNPLPHGRHSPPHPPPSYTPPPAWCIINSRCSALSLRLIHGTSGGLCIHL